LLILTQFSVDFPYSFTVKYEVTKYFEKLKLWTDKYFIQYLTQNSSRFEIILLYKIANEFLYDGLILI
jgi:hypothetical protein